MNYKMHAKMQYIYVGIDTHKYTHTASVINCFNEMLDTITINNDKVGYKALVDMVNKYTSDNLTPIYGLEDTKHLGYGLCSYLLDKNCLVKTVLSTLTYNERKRNPIISKTDALDSLCVAKVLLDFLDTLPYAKSDEIYWTLKQVVKMRRTIVKSNVEYKNKLHAQLLHHYPNYKDFFNNIFCNTALMLWETYPSPDLLPSSKELAEFLYNVSHKRFRVKKANEIIKLSSEFDIFNTIYQEERNIIIRTLVKQIKNNNIRLKEIELEIISIYDKIGAKLHTCPLLDKISASDVLSEIGNINRFENNGKLAKYAGVAPVNYSSGNSDKDVSNEYGNRELNGLIYAMACRSLAAGRNNNKPTNAIFLEYYEKKRANGKTKHQAIVCIMRRLISIIFHILKYEKEYEIPTELVSECMELFKERKLKEQEELEKKEQKRLLKREKIKIAK